LVPSPDRSVEEEIMSRLPSPVALAPSREELAMRLGKARRLMQEQGLDYYVVFDPTNIYYLTHFANNVHERPFILVISHQGAPAMLAPLLETSHVKARARCDLEYTTYDEFPAPQGRSWYDHYRGLIQEGSRVGIESTLPVGIAQRTPGDTVLTDIVDEVRIVKSDYEIGRSAHACQVVNLGHEKLLETCHPGVPEGAIYAAASQAMMARIIADIPEANFTVSRVVGAVWPPALSHDPHIIPTITTPMVEGGPHVSIVFAQVDGYAVELERTFFLGTVPERAREPFDVMFEARALAHELASPGACMAEIDRVIRRFIVDRGYGHCILHRTGHGLGITGHEAPYLADGYERELVPGMLISIEPGIYIPGVGGFRHSDSILITDDGCAKLTRAPETLAEVTIPL
jgi:Xaa-Pro dipeptidase